MNPPTGSVSAERSNEQAGRHLPSKNRRRARRSRVSTQFRTREIAGVCLLQSARSLLQHELSGSPAKQTASWGTPGGVVLKLPRTSQRTVPIEGRIPPTPDVTSRTPDAPRARRARSVSVHTFNLEPYGWASRGQNPASKRGLCGVSARFPGRPQVHSALISIGGSRYEVNEGRLTTVAPKSSFAPTRSHISADPLDGEFLTGDL